MILRYLGHSAVLIETGETTLLIDPFLDDNPSASIKSEQVDPDWILLTHAHGDHVGDTRKIAERTGAKLIAPVEIVNYLKKQGVEGIGMNIGGSREFPFGSIRFTPAWHSSSFADGTYGGMPTGIVVELEGKRIYHAGDTALFGDMRLIGDLGLDVALLPIGSNYTMGPAEAVQAAALLRAGRVIPIHYDTFPLIAQDAQAFARQLGGDSGQGVVLTPGEHIEL